jgi:hypothetical protein
MMQLLEVDMRCVLIGAALFFYGADPAHAQELASSFDQLRVLVKAGDRLTITDPAGEVTSGRLVRLAGASLEIDVDGTARTLAQDRVTTIRMRHADSLANGAKIGFAVGAGFGALAGLAVASELEWKGAVVGFLLVYGAMGAGIGVGIDGLTSSDRVIYSRPNPQTARLALAPLLGSGRRGLRLTVGF